MRYARSLAPVMAIAVLLVAACDKSPTEPTSWTFDRVREQLVLSNLNSPPLGQSGRLTRWRSPIPVNTNDIARAEEALAHYEQWTGGVIRFTRVTGVPANGLYFIEGGAIAPEEGGSCGNVTDAPPPESSAAITFRWDASRALMGAYTIHLGSDRCDDAMAGRYASSVAEHQLAHALGVIDHFPGFRANDGLDDARLLSVVYNLYVNPLGATANELSIWR